MQRTSLELPLPSGTRHSLAILAGFLLLLLFVEVTASSRSTATLSTGPSTMTPALVAARVMGASLSGVSGDLFEGTVIRKFPPSQVVRRFKRRSEAEDAAEAAVWPEPVSRSCVHWSVVTTIFEMSIGIRKTLALGPSWCTVVVVSSLSW